jgi:tight adherence protein B
LIQRVDTHDITMSPSIQMILIATLSFGSVALLAQIALDWWRRNQTAGARRLRGRLERANLASVAAEHDTSLVAVAPNALQKQLNQWLSRAGLAKSIGLLLSQSGLGWSTARLLTVCLISSVAFGLSCLSLNGSAPTVLVCAAAGAALPLLYVRRKRDKRLMTLEQQLPDVLDVIGRAMRSGYTFAGAMRVVAEEMPEPIGPEFARAQDEMAFGIPVKDALQNLLNRVPSENLRFMVVATVVQRETGGNLAEIFSRISRLMRERVVLQGQIRVLSADGRVSALILCLLPVLGAVAMFFLNRPYIARLWQSPEGHSLLMTAAVMMLAGVLWMRRVIRIRI